MNNLNIRKAAAKDKKRIKGIFRAEYAKFPWNEKWTEELATKRINNYLNYEKVFVLEIDKKVQGFFILSSYVWHTGLRGFIHEIVISSEFQGKGYGKKLINFVEEYFKKKGARDVQLITSPKSIAYQIYKKLNYKDEGFLTMYKELK